MGRPTFLSLSLIILTCSGAGVHVVAHVGDVREQRRVRELSLTQRVGVEAVPPRVAQHHAHARLAPRHRTVHALSRWRPALARWIPPLARGLRGDHLAHGGDTGQREEARAFLVEQGGRADFDNDGARRHMDGWIFCVGIIGGGGHGRVVGSCDRGE